MSISRSPSNTTLYKTGFTSSTIALPVPATKPAFIPLVGATALFPTIIGEPIPEQVPAPRAGAKVQIQDGFPFQPSIIDFYRNANFEGSDTEAEGQDEQDMKMVAARWPIKEILKGPQKLLKTDNRFPKKPKLRWIHLPFNSMEYTEKVIKKICSDNGISENTVSNTVLRPDRWMDRFHRKRGGDGYHARFMQTFSNEFTIDGHPPNDASEHIPDNFKHTGANFVLFMPYIHWGTVEVLEWRQKKLEKAEAAFAQGLELDSNALKDDNNSKSGVFDFYAEMMATQLNSGHPLHLRRTLDQYYYMHSSNTLERDHDQVVTKHGPDPKGKNRSILMVDQLWLWILGGKTIITSFDRRWKDDNDAQSNVFDNVIWKLEEAKQVKKIKTPYDLANLIIDEASSYFFSCSDALPESMRFYEIFQKAITQVSDQQTQLFITLANLNSQKAVIDLSRAQQNKLFDLSAEFELIKEVRDIADELNMIEHVYKEQLGNLSTLMSAQHHFTLFHYGWIDHNGYRKDDEGKEAMRARGGRRRLRYEPLPPIDLDGGDWFKRTKDYMEMHHADVLGMLGEIDRVYTALKDTIDLKQNNASVFEAHVSRRAGEAVLLFTIVSSIILPLSFFSSLFGMNVIEMTEGSKVTLGKAMGIAIPLSFTFVGLIWLIAFRRHVSDRLKEFYQEMTWNLQDLDLVQLFRCPWRTKNAVDAEALSMKRKKETRCSMRQRRTFISGDGIV